MKPLSGLIFSFSLLFILRATLAAAGKQTDEVYIVYMGAAASKNDAPRDDHSLILSSLLRRKRNALVYNYRHGLSGFAARLSKEEAESISKKPGVVSVFLDPVLKLHTTHSWDFLTHQTDFSTHQAGQEIDAGSGSDSSKGSDTIIGILDTGIWPESESFKDKDMGPIPSRWKGTFVDSPHFNSSNCNRKLIGARFYNDPDDRSRVPPSPRDINGHGSHVASTAAGSPVSGASYYGLAAGTAKGGSPGSRIAAYRVCTVAGCRGSSILAAFSDAIADGVDVLSLSLGRSAKLEPELSSDPIAIGAFHAVASGITVVCSAGNGGPNPQTVVNIAPWILTVAATTTDRVFESDVVLGGGKLIKGGGINFANIQTTPVYTLIYGRNCIPGLPDESKVKGKIILCENNEYTPKEKLAKVKGLGGIGVILIDDDARNAASIYGAFPFTLVSSKDGAEILSYINSNSNPVATILPTKSVTKYEPAPAVAYFSARGPSFSTNNLLKPDIAAPGVSILAAWPTNDTKVAIVGRKPPLFYILSGTSMACPHVSGIAATVKSKNPTWSPSAVKSAIMTTATQTNNMKEPITTDNGTVATPYDYGAGELTTTGPSQAGLVYETETIDYLNFLCNSGYDMSKIKLIYSTIPDGFSCPSNSSADLISNMNYPTIAISQLSGGSTKKVQRTVTNVGEDESLYTLAVTAPAGLEVKVVPEKLQFTRNIKKLSYEVSFSTTTASSTKGDMFGAIVWTSGKKKVRSAFVVRSDST